MPNAIQIAPSLLAADLARAGDEVRAVVRGGADILHVDVMDGHFAPNLSFGPAIAESLRPICRIPIGVHLMVTDPAMFLKPFADAGAGVIYFHQELDADLVSLAKKIRRLGAEPGVAIEMQTPADSIRDLVGHVRHILIMTVKCGYSGQAFNPRPLRKIPRLRELLGEDACICVDGGIDRTNAAAVVAAGANVLVAGKGIYGYPDPADAVRQLRRVAESAL